MIDLITFILIGTGLLAFIALIGSISLVGMAYTSKTANPKPLRVMVEGVGYSLMFACLFAFDRYLSFMLNVVKPALINAWG
ncbi:hypothetical protein [Vibrio phage vB_ValS_PJ32]|nr:hypothetical protein [Vibrio phage vB_ValS_PJ32]